MIVLTLITTINLLTDRNLPKNSSKRLIILSKTNFQGTTRTLAQKDDLFNQKGYKYTTIANLPNYCPHQPKATDPRGCTKSHTSREKRKQHTAYNTKLGGSHDIAKNQEHRHAHNDPATKDIYFEQQERQFCLVHSFNMAMQASILTGQQLLEFLDPYTIIGKRGRPLLEDRNANKPTPLNKAEVQTMRTSYIPHMGKFSNDCLHKWLKHSGWGQNQVTLLTHTLNRSKGTAPTGPIPYNSSKNIVLSPLPPGSQRALIQWDNPYPHSAALLQNPFNHQQWLLMNSELGRPVNLDAPTSAYGLGHMTSYRQAKEQNRSPTWKDLRGHLYSLPHPNPGTNEGHPHISHNQDTARPDQNPPPQPTKAAGPDGTGIRA